MAFLSCSWFSSSLFLLFILMLAPYSTAQEAAGGGRRPLVPAMFVFGDSLIDNGNNNNLPSLAKANYFPYGIDFAGGPTGRFANGYTIADEIGELLGLPLIPPFSQVSGSINNALNGVNYASAAAGILDISGRNFVSYNTFNQQIQNFASTMEDFNNFFGAQTAAESIARSVFFIGFGSNDYLNNYLMPNYNTRFQYNGDQFSDLLIQRYSKQLETLYSLGGRRFIIANVGVLGCIPYILSQNLSSHCSSEINNLVINFNGKLKPMLHNLNENLPGSQFVHMDIYSMFKDILENPRNYGFSVANRGCCGIGRNRGQISCLPLQPPCLNRDLYVFWDAFHPTSAVNIILARQSFSGTSDIVSPMNIQQLVTLNP
ncbi:GDSL esterase/lipase At1g71691-like [Phalaenopsis equestris]|uniref:GDSL esterase/lipase At1g71691-like n=1 Tax=Phalaenopsis equestris TaxID=78828 RepID=UPI0009E4BC09|nr:GDSL esterase/lipase At1g71691-like [Phalaenopsis equestris]